MTRPPATLPGLLSRVLSSAHGQLSDRQLLDRFTDSGDEGAFAAILDRHGPMLLGLCRRWVGDAHLGEDVLQATFLVLARKARAIRRRDSLAGWLYGVAQRLARQAKLADAARARRERRAAGKEAREADAGWDELLRALDEELQRLPERCRAPLLLCYLQGRAQDEAARQLGWSLSTLRRRLEEGRGLLRGRMARRGATLGAGLFAGFLAPSTACATPSDGLRRAVLRAVTAAPPGGPVPTTVLALANGGMQMTMTAKVVLWSALAVAAVGLAAGLVGQRAPATASGEPPTRIPPARLVARAPEGRADEPAGKPQVGRDRFQDPLPRGAVARLGTVAFRHGRLVWGGSLAFTPDGKHLVSTGGGWVRRWDLATGHATANLGDGWRSGSTGTDLATADGALARFCDPELSPTPTGGQG
jgi:RNA polymerase sigma factor (sigma-70 family)